MDSHEAAQALDGAGLSLSPSANSPARFLVDLHEASNEGRLRPRGSFDWPEQIFKLMRQTFQLSYSHDRERLFIGTIPQIQAACRWLDREGLRVGTAGESTGTSHPPVVCAACEDIAYATRCLPATGTPCAGCGEPLQFVCAMPHEGSCDWQAAS